MDEISRFESVRSWILQLPGVSESPHRFGGREFQIEGIEFMHSHGPSWLDIRLSKSDQASVLKSKEAHPRPFAPQAGWVSLQIDNPTELATVKKVIQLAYQNAKSSLEDVKTRRPQKSH